MISFVQQIANSQWFERAIIALILFTALLLGIEAFPQFMTGNLQARFNLLHDLILGAFILEALIKIIAASPRCANFQASFSARSGIQTAQLIFCNGVVWRCSNTMRLRAL